MVDDPEMAGPAQKSLLVATERACGLLGPSDVPGTAPNERMASIRRRTVPVTKALKPVVPFFVSWARYPLPLVRLAVECMQQWVQHASATLPTDYGLLLGASQARRIAVSRGPIADQQPTIQGDSPW